MKAVIKSSYKTLPLKKINELGIANALDLFHQASKQIPAYADFLTKNKVKASKISTINEFLSVPLTNKDNYINQYPLPSRCWNGQLSKSIMIASSSGTTGKQLYWPRDIEQDYLGAGIHFHLLKNIFHVDERKTLFLDVFSLGTWIAGMYTYTCVYLARTQGLPLTIMTPGLSIDDANKIINELGDQFEQIIVAGHPPTLKTISEKISSNTQIASKIRLIGAAEGVSRHWCEYVNKLLGVYAEPSFINIYGSADAGLMGFQTPFSINIVENYIQQIKENLPWTEDRPIYVYQYDPRFKYIESVDNRIVLTANQTAPLIRYDIHDIGFHLSEKETQKLLNKHLEYKNNWSFPTIAMAGRSGNVATIYAVNIYPENIKLALEHQLYQSTLTGRFILKTEFTEFQEQYLILRIELSEKTEVSADLELRLKKHIVSHLTSINAEYSKLESIFGERVHPKIFLHPNGHQEYFPSNKVNKSS